MGAGDAAVVGAVISAAVAVVVAIATQIGTSLRARTDRRYTARRAGLIEAQDAALELREALADYGHGIRVSLRASTAEPTVPGSLGGGGPAGAHATADTGVELSVDGSPGHEHEARRRQATGRFQVTVSRVQDPAVVAAMRTWESAASRRFISTDEVSASTEDEWFAYVQALCHAALTSTTGVTTDSSRRHLAAPRPLPVDGDVAR
jgi:hypothetical protein